MKSSLVLPLLVLLYGGFLQRAATDGVCTSQTGCKCVTANVTIDLSHYFKYPVNQIPDNTSPDNEKFQYIFSPCQAIACYKNQQAKAAVCQLNTLPGKENQSVSLGAFGKIEWVSVTDEYNFVITITGGHPNYEHKDREATFTFRHDTSVSANNITFVGESPPNSNPLVYSFEGKIVNPNVSGGTAAGIVGIVLIVIFIVVVATYFIVGGLIMYFMRGARGVEVIPNYTFWKDLPALIKDGFLFTISPCRNKFSEKGYQAL